MMEPLGDLLKLQQAQAIVELTIHHHFLQALFLQNQIGKTQVVDGMMEPLGDSLKDRNYSR